MKIDIKNIFKGNGKSKLGYRASSAVLIVLFLAAVIALNVIMTSISPYSDLSSNSLYTVSDAFYEHFTQVVSDSGVNINFVTMTDEATFRSYSWQTLLLYRTFKEIEKKFDFVKVIYKNTVKYPDLAEDYMLTPFDTPAITSVAVELADENGTRLPSVQPKLCAIDGFFTIDTDDNSYYAYNAESKIISVVMQLINKSEKPTAYYLQGHGEPTLEEASGWRDVLESAGYNAVEINFTDKNSLTEAGKSFGSVESGGNSSDIVIINSPKYDLFAPTEDDPSIISEKKLIESFLTVGHGHLIVAEDASCPYLPVLEQLMSEWGLGFGGGITDSVHSVQNSGNTLITADYSLTTSYYTTSDGKTHPPVQILNKILGDLSNPPMTVFGLAKAVTVNKDLMIKGVNGGLAAYGMLFPYKTADIKGEYTEDESVCMLGFSLNEWNVNDNNATKSYAVAIGSSDFLSASYASCANRSIMYALLELMYRDTVYFSDIKYKLFESEALTVEEGQSTVWTIVYAAVIPVIIAGAGVYVWIRRRHS